MKDKKVELSEQDLHIIDVYSKKNLADTMPQFGHPNYEFFNQANEMTRFKNTKVDDFFQ